MLYQRRASMSVRQLEHVSLATGYEPLLVAQRYKKGLTFLADILKFDNSYSWARSKEIFYSVKLLPPGAKPHLHVPPGEMDVGGAEGGNSSPSSSRSSEFFDCEDNDVNETPNGCHDDQQATKEMNTEVGGACASD